METRSTMSTGRPLIYTEKSCIKFVKYPYNYCAPDYRRRWNRAIRSIVGKQLFFSVRAYKKILSIIKNFDSIAAAEVESGILSVSGPDGFRSQTGKNPQRKIDK